MTIGERIQLITAQVEILKLKANIHDWSCYVPEPVKQELEATLVEIGQMLKSP